MKYRYARNTFVRHVCDESVVWCPCTGGCIVLRNAQRILEGAHSVPVCVGCCNEHSRVANREYVDFIANRLIDDAVRSAENLSKPFGRFWTYGEAIRRHDCARKLEIANSFGGISEICFPAEGIINRESFRYSDNYFIKQRICVRRPEYIHGPYPFAAFISSSFAAFSRHDSISSHVLSKSATLIITLVLRPFCVMTSGRCVHAVRRCVRTSSLRRVVCRSRCRRQDEKDSSRP